MSVTVSQGRGSPAALALKVALAGAETITGRKTIIAGGTGNSAMNVTTSSLGELEIRGNGTGAAMITFHRPAAHASYIGLDTDNVWKVGGWSLGANAYEIYHAGNKPTKADVGLANATDTSDANKPVSTAQAAAIALKANNASPSLTGVPLAPTAAAGTNTTQLATTAFVAAHDDTAKANAANPNLTGVVTVAALTGNGVNHWAVNGGNLQAGTGFITSQGTYDNTTASAANAYINSSGSNYRFARSTSSIKYKRDVETMDIVHRDAVLQLRSVWYRSKCENDNPEWGFYGLIAEEVALVDPALVHWRTHGDPVPKRYRNGRPMRDENGQVIMISKPLKRPEPEGVMYDRIVPHLLAIVADLRERIDALEARL